MSIVKRKQIRKKVHRRIRKKVAGSATCPRLAVHCSNKNIYAQIIDDVAHRTLCSASTLDKDIEGKGANADLAAKIGKAVAAKAKALKIQEVVYDRGGHLYHGKIKVLADAAREEGLKF